MKLWKAFWIFELDKKKFSSFTSGAGDFCLDQAFCRENFQINKVWLNLFSENVSFTATKKLFESFSAKTHHVESFANIFQDFNYTKFDENWTKFIENTEPDASCSSISTFETNFSLSSSGWALFGLQTEQKMMMFVTTHFMDFLWSFF